MRQLRTDVLVIGLGPAGASAARCAAEAGLRVLGVDRNRVIGEPVQCAEFIPMPLGRYAQPAGVRVQGITGMKSRLPSGAEVATPFPGIMIDRARFDQAIAKHAESAGALLQSGTRLCELDTAARLARLRGPDGEWDVRYRVLIAADGPRSSVAALLGLPALETVSTRQYTVALRVPYADTDIWLSDAFPGGYGWLFPKGELANLGLGADRRLEADLKLPLDRLHAQLRQAGFVGADILFRTGGAIPVGGLRERLVHGQVLFVGDAAGLTHPITGAGIAAAVISGERAGEAAAGYLGGDAEALADFEEEVREQFEETLSRAVARRAYLARHWRTPRAHEDAVMRRGWIAFPEYFASEPESLLVEEYE
jgi:digeranylgeranylglycerophospholipid reductase